MKRRIFLQFSAVLGIAAFDRTYLRMAAASRIAPFYIAGVRYQNPPVRKQIEGDRLLLLRETYEDNICYAVYTADWDMLGYVPDALVPGLLEVPQCAATLSMADQHAVPWKRYLVQIGAPLMG